MYTYLLLNEGLDTISKHCLNLKSLNLSWCDKVTDAGLDWIGKNFRKLRVEKGDTYSYYEFDVD